MIKITRAEASAMRRHFGHSQASFRAWMRGLTPEQRIAAHKEVFPR